MKTAYYDNLTQGTKEGVGELPVALWSNEDNYLFITLNGKEGSDKVVYMYLSEKEEEDINIRLTYFDNETEEEVFVEEVNINVNELHGYMQGIETKLNIEFVPMDITGGFIGLLIN